MDKAFFRTGISFLSGGSCLNEHTLVEYKVVVGGNQKNTLCMGFYFANLTAGH